MIPQLGEVNSLRGEMRRAATRHTAASRWVMGGTPIAVVSRFLGHGSIQMTMRYSLLQPDNDDRAVEAMMSFYNKKKT